MNKAFKVIWNHATQTWVAASEIARAKGKTKSVKTAKTALAAAIATVAIGGTAQAATSISGQNSVTDATAAVDSAIAISSGGANALPAVANAENSIAIGNEAYTRESATYSIAIGTNTSTLAENGIAIGTNAHSTGNAIVIGLNATASGLSDDPNTPNREDVQQGASGAVVIGENAKALAPTGAASASVAIGLNASAKGEMLSDKTTLSSVAVGENTAAIDGGVAIGVRANANQSQFAIAVGAGSQALGDRSTAVGTSANASAQQAVASGYNANASGVASLALGSNATSSGGNSVAISGMSSASGAQSMALGYYANAAGKNSVAVGSTTGASADRATAVGYYSKAQALDAAVLGSVANASAVNATAIGRFANAMKADSIAVGTFTHTPTVEAVAIGTNSATGVTRAEWDNLNALHLERLAQDAAWDDVNAKLAATNLTDAERAALQAEKDAIRTARGKAHGAENAARSALALDRTTKGEIVIGSHSLAKGNDSIIVGNNNTITTANTFVLGHGINRGADLTTDGSGTVANSVYLGNESEATAGAAVGTTLLKINQEAGGTTTTAGDTGTVADATVGGVTYGGFAGATANGVVTVGASGAERRIQNVAAGEISATSTDAINGSQLYLVTKGTLDQFPVIYTDTDGNKLVKAPDGNFYPADTVLIDGKYYPKGTTPEQVADGTAKPATPVDAGDVIASMNDGDNKADAPKTLANVKGNLTPTYNVGDMTIDATTGVPSDVASTTYTKSQTGPNATTAAAMYNNAATVGDILNAGWNLKVNDEAVDFVKPYDAVAFVNGTGTTARIDYTNGTQSNVTFDINVDDKTITIGEDGKLTAITPAPVIITKEGPINLENTNTTRIEVNQTTGNVSVNVNTGTSKVDENGKAVPNTTVDAGRVATIGDITTTINNTGWNILNHAGERVDLVNPADNVQFKQGTGTQVTVTSEDGKTSIVTYSAKIDGTTIKADANGTLYADMPAPTIITKDGALNFENTETATIVTNPTTGNISVKVETGVASVSDGAAKDADGKTVPAGKAIADANNANKVATVGNIVDVINNSGFGLLANGTNASTVNPGDTVDLKNTDGNVVITKAADSNDVEFNLAKNITIGQSVTAPTVNVGGDAGNTALTTVAGGNYNSAGQKIDDTAVPALSVGGNQITNVANGAISPSSTDAINGSQLYAVQNNFNQQIGAVNNRIDDLDSNRKAGSASAMAAAGLPQAYREGQSGFVAAVGQYEGETGVAVGFTSISDNGKWLFRGSYATNSQNENAGNLGIGYFW